MTRCEDIRDQLVLFVDGATDDGRVAAHVAGCAGCAAEVAEIRALLSRVQMARPHEHDERDARHWQDLARGIRLAIDAAPPPRPAWWRRPLVVVPVTAFAAAAVALLLLLARWPSPAPETVTARPQPVERTFEVEDLGEAELAAAIATFDDPAPDGPGDDADDDELALADLAAADETIEELDIDDATAARISAAL